MNANRPPQRPDATNKPGTFAEALHLEQQKQLAKGRLDRAYQLKVDGDDAGARLSLAEAVRTDAALVTDPTAVALAQSLTGQPRDKAILALMEHSQTAPVPSRHPRFRITADGYGFAVEAALLPLMLTLFFAALFPLLTLVLLGQNGYIAANMGRQFSVVTGIWPYVGSGIGVAIWILIDVFSAYSIGTLLGGSGVLVRFVRRLTRAVTLWAAVMTIAAVIGLIGLTRAGLITLGMGGELQVSILVTVCVWVLDAGIVIGPIVFGLIAGRTHEIGWLKGIVAVVLSSSVLGVLTLLLAGVVHLP